MLSFANFPLEPSEDPRDSPTLPNPAAVSVPKSSFIEMVRGLIVVVSLLNCSTAIAVAVVAVAVAVAAAGVIVAVADVVVAIGLVVASGRKFKTSLSF